MRRPVVVLAVVVAIIAILAAGLEWLWVTPKPPPGAPRAERLYYARCAECHGVDRRGSWRATLFFIRPGDLTNAGRMSQHSDRYLFDIVKHGGAPIGRPGMPAFGAELADPDIEELVRYLRELSRKPAALGERQLVSGWLAEVEGFERRPGHPIPIR